MNFNDEILNFTRVKVIFEWPFKIIYIIII